MPTFVTIFRDTQQKSENAAVTSLSLWFVRVCVGAMYLSMVISTVIGSCAVRHRHCSDDAFTGMLSEKSENAAANSFSLWFVRSVWVQCTCQRSSLDDWFLCCAVQTQPRGLSCRSAWLQRWRCCEMRAMPRSVLQGWLLPRAFETPQVRHVDKTLPTPMPDKAAFSFRKTVVQVMIRTRTSLSGVLLAVCRCFDFSND